MTWLAFAWGMILRSWARLLIFPAVGVAIGAGVELPVEEVVSEEFSKKADHGKWFGA